MDQDAADLYERLRITVERADKGVVKIADEIEYVLTEGYAYALNLELRPQRIYKPYALHLLKFTHKTYLGTDTPRDYTSLVQLNDPSRNESRELKIWMNHPLRHGGETFYQSGLPSLYTGTILQVVHNGGWWLPYLSCVLVAGGMLIGKQALSDSMVDEPP